MRERKDNIDTIYDIDINLSMGENALLLYEDILEKKVLNKIIISTILKLHKKGYVEFYKNNKNELIVKIKKGIEKLKISEIFVYECLNTIDRNSDSVLTLDEFNVSDNKVFAKNKNKIKELIIQEALEDKLLDVKRYKKKRKYFFRAMEILLILICSFLIPIRKMVLCILTISLLIFIKSPGFITKTFLNKPKHTLKKGWLNDEMWKCCSKIEWRNIITEFLIYISTFYLNLYLIEKTSLYINVTFIFLVEMTITLIFAIIEYIKFRKIDVYTDKAIFNKMKLKELEKFLKDNSLIEERETIEIYIWEDYLTFSVLLGINEKIPDEIKMNSAKIKNKSGIYYNYYDNSFRNN